MKSVTRLMRFDHEVREIIHANGARRGSSALLDGVFWSGDLKRATYERSREFDVDQVGREPPGPRRQPDPSA
ncbi:hypothetical protein ABZ402_27375 [Streptomyces mirabilis]|uniref:hypothetical protein n=1 Tax=Streptomyces mirabilis TaxID=68239 RepID=UPI0033C90A8C